MTFLSPTGQSMNVDLIRPRSSIDQYGLADASRSIRNRVARVPPYIYQDSPEGILEAVFEPLTRVSQLHTVLPYIKVTG